MSKDIFSVIFENFKDGYLITDKDGTVIFANNSYCQATQSDKATMLGKKYLDLMHSDSKFVCGKIIDYVYNHIERIEETVHIQGTNRSIHVTGIPLFDENNELLYVLVGFLSSSSIRNLYDYLTLEGSRNVQDSVKYVNRMKPEDGSEDIIAESKNMKEVLFLVSQISQTDVSVLITGPSGTGKEVVADLIYQSSKRKGKPFVKINCSAIPVNLMEAELFGYAEGAFTGALKGGKPGLFEVANGGVVFLDEIGDMPIELQPKILRLLQTQEVMRVGGRTAIPLDVRIISATNKNLTDAITNKEFRADLYYRLNVVPIKLLPLNQRKEDIEFLVNFFLKKFNKLYEKTVGITNVAMNMLKQHEWVGNIRELKNMVERMVVINTIDTIDSVAVSSFLGKEIEKQEESEYKKKNLYFELEKIEKKMILDALKNNKSKRKAALELGIDHSTLLKKCKKYDL